MFKTQKLWNFRTENNKTQPNYPFHEQVGESIIILDKQWNVSVTTF